MKIILTHSNCECLSNIIENEDEDVSQFFWVGGNDRITNGKKNDTCE